ncbi:MAG: DNA mismatch repair endonuclease MutL [Moraxellaceae bacterium]|nr:DNA mismatch repair endonuclease MutL [Moraxellaceae bacterium]
MTTQRIKKLSPLLINQLSAGEVVTRPASVVKELLENAIDSGATNIDIRITQGGMETIEIIDNGCGIHPDDMLMAVTRHATSKVADVEHLHGIETLGFRGEALASISAVSRFSLTSSADNSGVGRRLSIAGQVENPNIVPIVCPQGTSVLVQDLYFNVPARRGNLKSIATEYAHIETIVRQIALAYANINLSLSHDGKNRLKLSANNKKSLLNRLQQAIGKNLPQAKEFFVDLSPLCSEKNNDKTTAKINGWFWLGKDLPKLIYVNNRLIKDNRIGQQILQSLHSLEITANEIGYALFFELPNDWLNLNIHPSKQRINIHTLANINAHLHQGLQKLFAHQPSKISEKSPSLGEGLGEGLEPFYYQKQQQTKQENNFSYKQKTPTQTAKVASPKAVYQVDKIPQKMIKRTEPITQEKNKQFQLQFITTNQNSEKKAEKLAELICQTLQINKNFQVEPYYKMANSYKISFTFAINQDKNSIIQMIELSDRICTPWLVEYHRDSNEISLIFNKNKNSHFRKIAFNVIEWGSFSC